MSGKWQSFNKLQALNTTIMMRLKHPFNNFKMLKKWKRKRGYQRGLKHIFIE